MLKLKDFKEKNKIENLAVYVQDTGQYNRNLSLIECLDFVDSCEYLPMGPGSISKGVSRNATVIKNGRQERVDYYFCLSDILTRGHRVETWMPEYKTDFNIKFKTEKPKNFKKKSPTAVIFPSSEGLAKAWLNGFDKEQWAILINRLISELGVNVVLIGSEWDKSNGIKIIDLVKNKEKCLSMVGETTLPQVLYLLKETDLMIGAISGMTILANHFRTPTIALYPEHEFREEFVYTWTPPGYKDYFPIKSNANIADEILNRAKEFLIERSK